MSSDLVRFKFGDATAFADAERSLHLALLAADALHGTTQMRIEARVWIDAPSFTCVVDAATAAGRSIARIFTGFVERMLGEDAFEIDRVGVRPAGVTIFPPATAGAQ